MAEQEKTAEVQGRRDTTEAYGCLLNWHNKLGRSSPLQLIDDQSEGFGEVKKIFHETKSLVVLREPIRFADGQKRKYGALTNEGRIIAFSVKVIKDIDTIDFSSAKEVFDISIDSERQNMKAVISYMLNQTMVDMRRKSEKINTILENLVIV